MSIHSALELNVAERLAKAFEAKYPDIAVRVERSGAERVFQRIGQEYASNIHAVDVVNTADQAHVIEWKRQAILAQYLPEEVVKYYDKKYYDPEGFELVTRVLVSPFGINTDMVKMADAPKSFADLLDPKWKGKMVKAHPAYSGTCLLYTSDRQREGRGLASSGLCNADDIAALHGDWNGLILDRGGGDVFFIHESAVDRLYEAEIVK